MKKTRGLTFRILLIILLGGGLIVVGTCGYSYLSFLRQTERIARDSALQLSEVASVRFAVASRPIVRQAEIFEQYEGLASQWVLYAESVDSRKLGERLGSLLLDSPYLSSVGVLLDPATWQRTREEATHAPYAIRSGDTFLLRDLAETGMDYLDADFFTEAMTEKESRWVEPMIQSADIQTTACYAYPFEHGVMLFGVSSEWIASVMQGMSVPLGGTIRIRSAEGEELFRSTGASIADEVITYSETLSLAGWELEVVYPAREMTGAARDLITRIVPVALIALTGMALLALLVTTSASRSLRSLRKNIARLSESFEENALPASDVAGAEIGDLAESVEAMQLNMARRIADTERDLVAREGERKDLEIAADFRKNFFAPPIWEEAKFSVATHLNGSGRLRRIFYDIVPTDRGTVYLAVGEMHGEEAASILSLCAVLSFLRAVLSDGHKPNKALQQLGELLSRFGVEGAGVSMLLAEFYLFTGTCIFASADYPNAMAVRENASARIDLPESAFVGAGESAYANVIINMKKGDTILMHSADLADGNGKPLSTEELSLYAATAVQGKTSCSEALDALMREISCGVETRAVSSDDVLMLFRYK